MEVKGCNIQSTDNGLSTDSKFKIINILKNSCRRRKKKVGLYLLCMYEKLKNLLVLLVFYILNIYRETFLLSNVTDLNCKLFLTSINMQSTSKFNCIELTYLLSLILCQNEINKIKIIIVIIL